MGKLQSEKRVHLEFDWIVVNNFLWRREQRTVNSGQCIVETGIYIQKQRPTRFD